MRSSSIHAGLVVLLRRSFVTGRLALPPFSWNKLAMKQMTMELYRNEICAIESFLVALFAFVSTCTPISYCLATPCDWNELERCDVWCSVNAGLFPKPLHVLFAWNAGVKQSVQAASLELHVTIQCNLKRCIWERPGLGISKGSELSCTKFAPSSLSAWSLTPRVLHKK